MGNWHCVPNSFALVSYREYLSPKIRWRYPGEAWSELVADSYTTKVIDDLTANTAYRVVYRSYNTALNPPNWSAEIVRNASIIANGIQSYRMRVVDYTGASFYAESFIANYLGPVGQRQASFYLEYYTQGNFFSIFLGTSSGLWLIRIQRANPPRPTLCEFKIFNKGNIVFSSTRSVCPEVETLPCELSALEKEIAIDKLRYIKRVEVIPYAYDMLRLPGIPFPVPVASVIPPNCLNIYRNDVYVPIPPEQFPFENDNFEEFGYIDQICSAPGCPPPEYIVSCSSKKCESCPPGTCPVVCAEKVCCYNDYGVSIREIPLIDYCGES